MKIEKHEKNQSLLEQLDQAQRKEYDKFAQYSNNVRNCLLNDDYKGAQQRSVIIGRHFSDWAFSYDDALDSALYALFNDYACQIVHEMLMLEDKDDLCALALTVKNLMGRSPQFASPAQFDTAILEGIASNIKRCRYKDYPFVIVSSYVPIAQREYFAKLIMNYGRTKQQMDWAMANCACITLSYLQVLPEQSVKFLAEKLNQGGCDAMPYEGAMDALPYFSAYIDDALQAIIESFEEIQGDGNLIEDYFVRLSQCISTKSQAEKILPAFCEHFIKDHADYPMDFSYNAGFGDAPRASVLAFYGQLQVLMNFPHCVQRTEKKL